MDNLFVYLLYLLLNRLFILFTTKPVYQGLEALGLFPSRAGTGTTIVLSALLARKLTIFNFLISRVS